MISDACAKRRLARTKLAAMAEHSHDIKSQSYLRYLRRLSQAKRASANSQSSSASSTRLKHVESGKTDSSSSSPPTPAVNEVRHKVTFEEGSKPYSVEVPQLPATAASTTR